MTLNVFDLPPTSPLWRDPCILGALYGKSSDHPLYLSLDDAREIINASAYSVKKKTPHLVNMTIRWEMMPEFSPRDWLAHQGILFEKMRKWLVRNNVPVAFIWAREIGRINGAHSHVLLHLPADHWGTFAQFMVEAGGFVPRDHTGHAVYLSGGAYGTKTHYMRAGHAAYLLKSLDPSAVCRSPSAIGGTRPLMEALGVDDRDEPRLPLVGKRCGASHTLGPKARRAAGWRELHSVAELHAYLHPGRPQ